MKPRVLIFPSAIRSHVLPSLYVADLMAEEYEIFYAIQNDILEELVVANGHQAIRQTGNLVGYSTEPQYLASKGQPPSFWSIFWAYYTNEIYFTRQQELFNIINDIQPTFILIDLFACTDYWVLYPRKEEFNILFFNPMPSTYSVQGFPTVSEGFWNDTKAIITPSKQHKITLTDWFSHPKVALMRWVIARQRKKLQQIAPLAEDATVTQVIANVPELVLSPLTFEYSPQVRKPHQYYLGLCMRPYRQDTELDPAFEEVWERIVGLKTSPSNPSPALSCGSRAGVRLIYCSFGTFHEGADATLLRFVSNLLEVIAHLPGMKLICATNRYLIETLRHRCLLKANTHFFTRVPQMRVLAKADVFITHAGFGSIKEAIYYGVPMLAYPLDPRYDQNGNALKIEYHGLGLRGHFVHERPNDLKNKLLRLLEEDTFRVKMTEFKAKTLNDSIKDVLAELIATNTKHQSYAPQPC